MDDRTRRRKLIQGSLAAPLVLTVGRSAASPRTTFSACLSNTEHQPEPTHVAFESDEVFRISRDVYEFRRHEGGKDPKVREQSDDDGRPDRGADKRGDRYIFGWDDQTLYRIDGSRLVPQPLDFSPAGFGRPLGSDLQPTGKKVDILAYVGEDGTVLGIAPQRVGGQWTTKRCYASIVGLHEEDSSPPRYRWWS